MANQQTRELRRLSAKKVHSVTLFSRTTFNAKGKKHHVDIVEHEQGRTAFDPTRAKLKNKKRYQAKKQRDWRPLGPVTSLIG